MFASLRSLIKEKNSSHTVSLVVISKISGVTDIRGYVFLASDSDGILFIGSYLLPSKLLLIRELSSGPREMLMIYLKRGSGCRES